MLIQALHREAVTYILCVFGTMLIQAIVKKIGMREGALYGSWYYFFAIWSIVPEGIKDQGFTNISSSRGSTIDFADFIKNWEIQLCSLSGDLHYV